MTLAEQAIHLKLRRRRSRRGLKSGQRRHRDLPPLILMTDEVRLTDPEAAVDALPRGSAVIFRHYRANDRRAIATRLAGICRRRGLKLLIAGDARLAIEVGAQGLHLPEYLARRLACHRWGRRGSRPDWLITVAAHSLIALQHARHLGADAALLAPVFATASHPDTRPLGPLRFSAWAGESPVPVYALGGVTAANAGRLAGSGAAGIAGIAGFAGDEEHRGG
ncbi:MAG: thiamine phosphate synthase [Alphaproteobacteria bacterium]|nr:thiamine phosphate synthase [Alphaproteobacteria bacterium]